MIKDEGAILRRLMGTFSLRPTIVSISPLGGAQSLNYPLNTMAVTQVTSIPIINMRIPYNVRNLNVRVHLNEALEQPDLYVENKMIVAKVKNIIHCRDVLMFYVNRRFQNINFASLAAPYNFNMLPITTTGFETLNDVPVNYDSVVPIGSDDFKLRSVVMVEKAGFVHKDAVRDINNDLIIGCTAGIIVPSNVLEGRFDTSYLIYDPLGASFKFEQADKFKSNPPITWVPGMSPLFDSGALDSFEARAQRRGTIWVYVKDNQK